MHRSTCTLAVFALLPILALTGCKTPEWVVPTETERTALETSIKAELTALESVQLTEESIYPVLDSFLAKHADAYGTTFALDPAYAGKQLAPYAYRRKGTIAHRTLAVDGYDYPMLAWFALPRKSGKAMWSEPYFDAGGGDVEMMTFSVPVTKDGRFMGILTADFELKEKVVAPTGSSDVLGAPIAAADAAGSWTLVDDENVTFDVVLATDGGAASNWSKGPHGARGESGHWVIADGRIVIDYVDGWRDVILRKPTGELAKRSWGPGVARDAAPSNFGQAVRTPASYASWIGVYELPVAQSTTGEKFAIAIQSSHVAWKSIDEVKVGCWWIADGFLRIRWANGWCDELHTVGADYEVRSWKPGTPADANGRPTGAPTNTGRASRAK